MRVHIVRQPRTCELGSFLTQKVRAFLWRNDHLEVDSIEKADSVIVETCVHLESLKRLSFETIREVVSGTTEDLKGKRLIVAGCLTGMPETCDRVLASAPNTSSEDAGAGPEIEFVHPMDLDRFNDLFKHSVPIGSVSAGLVNRLFPIRTYQPHLREGAGRYVEIAQGCENHCTYCIAPSVKGPTRSRTPDEIRREVEEIVADGHRVVTLLADDCGCWGADLGLDAADLLETLGGVAADLVVQFIYFHPSRLIRLFDRLEPHFASGRIGYINVPIQSASDRILRRMGREYRIAEILRRIAEIREIAPETVITSHVIFGFPGESEGDFRASMDVGRVFDAVMYVAYSDNRQVAASRFGCKVPMSEVQARSRRLDRFIDRSGIDATVVGPEEVGPTRTERSSRKVAT